MWPPRERCKTTPSPRRRPGTQRTGTDNISDRRGEPLPGSGLLAARGLRKHLFLSPPTIIDPLVAHIKTDVQLASGQLAHHLPPCIVPGAGPCPACPSSRPCPLPPNVCVLFSFEEPRENLEPILCFSSPLRFSRRGTRLASLSLSQMVSSEAAPCVQSS